ncbi:MAG: ParB/RepB/Spo0J family partition protein [Desulfovibrionaceae bacterium]|jgi:ParB family chromosome partitioning protein
MNSGRTYVNGDVYTLDMDEIRLDPNQPKEHYNEDVVIEKLTRAIKDHLFFQPVFFKLDDDGKPVLILGGRRYTAARRAGLKTIPGVYCDGRLCEVSVVSNLMLGDLTPVEEAEALRQALAMRYTIDQLALALGRPPDAIREALTLNRLPVEVLDECRRDPEYERQELLRIARTRDEEEMRKLFCDYRRRLYGRCDGLDCGAADALKKSLAAALERGGVGVEEAKELQDIRSMLDKVLQSKRAGSA